jgi:glucose dehydrogenase
VSVGNAAADFNVESRAGANLYTDSLVVLDAKTGALKWYYQLRNHDDKDLDLGAAPMLFNLKDGRAAIALGSKDGYVYIVDRGSHKLLHRTPVTTILNQGQPVTEHGIKVCPSVLGGVEWNGPAADILHQAVVVGAVDWCAFVAKAPKLEHTRGELFMGGTFKMLSDPPPSGWITSVDQETGQVRWSFHADAPVVSGVTATAGGLVFAGDMAGNLYALDSADGTVKFKTNTGGAVAGGIIEYRMTQQYYVAVTSGNISRAIWGETGLPTVVIYRLDSGHVSSVVGGAVAGNLVTTPDATHGRAVYVKICSSCHGAAGEGLAGPALRGVGQRMSVGEIAAWIMNPVVPGMPAQTAGIMPRLYPSVLTEQDVLDAAAYAGKL